MIQQFVDCVLNCQKSTKANTMTLQEFFQQLPRGAKSVYAERMGITRTYMSLLIAGRRKPSPELAKIIELVTKRKVRRIELRPDIFGAAK